MNETRCPPCLDRTAQWTELAAQMMNFGWQIVSGLAAIVLLILKLILDRDDILDVFSRRKQKRGMRAKVHNLSRMVASVDSAPLDRTIVLDQSGSVNLPP